MKRSDYDFWMDTAKPWLTREFDFTKPWPTLDEAMAYGKQNPVTNDQIASYAVDMASPFAKIGGLLGMVGSRTRLLGKDLPAYQQSYGAGGTVSKKQADRVRDEFDLITRDTVDKMSPMPKTLSDYEGRRFVTSMSDTTAAGDKITHFNGIKLKSPVERTGGQDHMMWGNQLWGSAQGAVSNIYNVAGKMHAKGGQNPLFLPFLMGGGGSGFSKMPAKTAVEWARSGGLPDDELRLLNKEIQEKIPGFNIYRNPQGQIDKLKPGEADYIQGLLHTRHTQGTGPGLNRLDQNLAVADPALMPRDQGSLYNVGILDTYHRPSVTGGTNNPAYPSGVWGEIDGRLKPEGYNVFDLLPDWQKVYGIDPRQINKKTTGGGIKPTDPMYLLKQSGAQGGLIDHQLLMRLDQVGLLGD